MKLNPTALIALVFAATAVVALGAARIAVGFVEAKSVEETMRVLKLADHGWAEVQADGLQIIVSGTAPTEAGRFRALAVTGTVVDAARVIDDMQVEAPAEFTPPHFSIEILRNDDGLSLIGLVPSSTDRELLQERLSEIAAGEVTDFLETANYPKPTGWDRAVSFGLDALDDLPRSKISISSKDIHIEAISDSAEQKKALEASLARRTPPGLTLSLDISAPRPVITPFSLRFIIDPDGSRFDACSADSVVTRDTILAAARAAGLEGKADCTIGLGVPSTDWADAVSQSIASLAAIGGGSITFSDADVTLVAADGVAQDLFDRHTGELKANLPDVYALYAVLPEPVIVDGSGEGDGPPEFVATKSPEGQVQLRGRLSSDRQRIVAENFARARFGADAVFSAARLDEELPRGWSVRVLAGLEALATLNNGVVVVQADFVELRGVAFDPDAQAKATSILAEKLGEAENFSIAVRYQEQLVEEDSPPTPEECIAGINEALVAQKITFEPSSTNIRADALKTINAIADILENCPDVPMEIAGHTDSQGREEMNQALSASRANAVLVALQARRVLTGNLRAVGYGESVPIADNETEEGREANRRIEFTLIAEEPAEESPPVVEQDAAASEDPLDAVLGEDDIEVQVESADSDDAPPAPLARPADAAGQ
jgi:OOP family OmpA-OmpF porin